MEKEKLNGLYFVKVNWYCDYEDTEKTACAFVVAYGYADAVAKVSSDFQYINSMTIEEVQPIDYCDINCIYVPDDPNLINKVREANAF